MNNLADLLDNLACPQCKGTLILQSDTQLLCQECNLVYPVINGIGVLLTEKAIPATPTVDPAYS